MDRLLLMGLNHCTAPLEVREKLAFDTAARAEALRALRRRFVDAEAVLLSTCNRVELYVARPVHGRPNQQEMVQLLADVRRLTHAEFENHLYHKSQREAIEHLFSVTSSLDSMVIGETQILGQVREAYETARDLGVAGAAMNPLFQRAIAVGKEVRTRTPIAEGRVSVASVAIDCARHIFDRFSDKTVLTLGAGKMAALVLQGFAQLEPKKLLICNRDAEKADALAGKFNGEAAPFEKLHEHLVAADVVITSTSATEPIIRRERFEPLLKQRRYRPIFLIDIALPRDVEPSLGELKNVYLYNLNDLQQVVRKTHSDRDGAVQAAQRIINEHVERYLQWGRAREMGPLIERLYQKQHELAREELERTLAKLPGVSEENRAQLEELARRIVNKLLHDPVKRLRDAEHTRGVPYLHTLEKLFELSAESTETGDAEQQRD